MPTSHPRLALTRDPELDEALRRAAPLLGEDKPAAALARELILRGVQQVLADRETDLDRWLAQFGARPPLRPREELLEEAARLGPPAADDPYAITRALEEQRAERP